MCSRLRGGKQGSVSSPSDPELLNSEQGLLAPRRTARTRPLRDTSRAHAGPLGTQEPSPQPRGVVASMIPVSQWGKLRPRVGLSLSRASVQTGSPGCRIQAGEASGTPKPTRSLGEEGWGAAASTPLPLPCPLGPVRPLPYFPSFLKQSGGAFWILPSVRADLLPPWRRATPRPASRVAPERSPGVNAALFALGGQMCPQAPGHGSGSRCVASARQGGWASSQPFSAEPAPAADCAPDPGSPSPCCPRPAEGWGWRSGPARPSIGKMRQAAPWGH